MWERERKREKEGGMEVGALAVGFPSLYWPGHFLGHPKPRSSGHCRSWLAYCFIFYLWAIQSDRFLVVLSS